MEMTKKDVPYLSDPLLVPRVQEYLESNIDKTYVDINKMADCLQKTYKEYSRLKQNPFRLIVKKAYSLVMQSYGLNDNNESSSEENDSDDSVQETPLTDNDMNYSFYNMAAKQIEQPALDPDVLIDISSDDSQDAFKDKADNSEIEPNKTQKEITSKSISFAENARAVIANIGNDAGRKRKVDPIVSKSIVFKKKRPITVNQEKRVTFKDVGGMGKVMDQICKLLIHMRYPEIYKHLGVTPPRGFLLHGPPGCGKTLLVHAIAGEFRIPIVNIAATELVAGVSGESEERIRDLFDHVQNMSPCILFIDEIDAITPNRQTAQKDMERRIVAQLITCLDSLSQNDNGDRVLVIGATNRPESIDPGLRRSGRFDKEIGVGIPDVKERIEILKVLTRNLKLSSEFDYEKLSKFTPGYVGADLVALIREAALEAINRKLPEIHDIDSVNKDTVLTSSTENNKIPNSVNSTDLVFSECTKSNNAIQDNIKNDKCEDELVENCTDKGASPKHPSNQTPNALKNTENCIQTKKFASNIITWLTDMTLIRTDKLQSLEVTIEDFEKALKTVQPSAKREGFVTVPDVTWNDIGSLKDVREELQMAILGPIFYAKEFSELGLTASTGILLCGPPGCGKTLLAKAIANEASINFISVKGPELLNMYVGESERAVRVCFERARNSSPCVIFFDEFDAICPKRSDSKETGATMRVVNQMLTEMDGMDTRAGVFVLAATNRPDIIDPAILRPGRLDKTIFVNLPSAVDRVDILKTITKNGTKPRLSEDVDLDVLGKSSYCQGYTGADLNALVKEGGIIALKQFMSNKDTTKSISITNEHFTKALQKIKPSVSIADQKYYAEMRERYTSIKQNVEEMECS